MNQELKKESKNMWIILVITNKKLKSNNKLCNQRNEAWLMMNLWSEFNLLMI